MAFDPQHYSSLIWVRIYSNCSNGPLWLFQPQSDRSVADVSTHMIRVSHHEQASLTHLIFIPN